jgi:uncharacterized membrane protein
MNSRTASVVLHAPKEDVFSYLSKTENLPKWANIFCKELKVVNGKNKIVTPLGEMFFEIRSDKETGVIDMFAGPIDNQMSIFPVRVLDIPGGGASVVLFTMFQTPGLADEQFDAQYEQLKKELQNIKTEFMVKCI